MKQLLPHRRVAALTVNVRPDIAQGFNVEWLIILHLKPPFWHL